MSGLAPLLLAVLCRTNGPSYWHGIFQAIAINPLGADLMYTIAMLVVTDAFPAKMQALAGGVFNMLAQIGKSIRIATIAMIAQQMAGTQQGGGNADTLLRGYHAGWYYNCGMGFLSALVSVCKERPSYVIRQCLERMRGVKPSRGDIYNGFR